MTAAGRARQHDAIVETAHRHAQSWTARKHALAELFSVGRSTVYPRRPTRRRHGDNLTSEPDDNFTTVRSCVRAVSILSGRFDFVGIRQCPDSDPAAVTVHALAAIDEVLS